MLNVTLRPIEDIHDLWVARSTDLLRLTDEGGQVLNGRFPHRIVQGWQAHPRLVPHTRHSRLGHRQFADREIGPAVRLGDRMLVDGYEYRIAQKDTLSDPHLEPAAGTVPGLAPHEQPLSARDAAAWHALAGLVPGDWLTVQTASAVLPVIVWRTFVDSPNTEDASVICLLGSRGTRIEVTHDDLMTGARTFTHSTEQARIRPDVFSVTGR
jgi:hypothetical protein